MEFLAFLPVLLFVFLPMFLVGRRVLEPYMNGTKFVDPLKRPTLYRAQRILRANNTKARETEAKIKIQHFDSKRLEVEKAIDKAIEKNRLESSTIHAAEVEVWMNNFKAITAEEDERKRKEEEARLAEIRKIEAAKAEEERQRNIAIWEANEKVRLARFKAEQKALEDEQARRLASLTRKRDQDIQSLQTFRRQDNNNMSYGQRIVAVHGLYVRKLPTKAAREEGNLMQGASIGINGWIRGEELYGNPIWFKLANDVGWVWSGGVDNKSTSGLINYNYMNEPGDSFVTKSADGMICQTYTAPSQMQSMIDAEIAAMKQELEAAAWSEAMRNPFQTLNANVITASKITVGSIDSTPAMEISSAGMRIKNGDHTQNFMAPKKKSDDFWAGTDFADPDYFDPNYNVYDID